MNSLQKPFHTRCDYFRFIGDDLNSFIFVFVAVLWHFYTFHLRIFAFLRDLHCTVSPFIAQQRCIVGCRRACMISFELI